MILPIWFHNLGKRFSYKEVQFKTFCKPVRTTCPPDEKVNETPAIGWKEGSKLNQLFINFLTCMIPPLLMSYMSGMNQSFQHNSRDQVTENQEEIFQRQNSLVQRTTTCHPWTECK